MTNVSCCNDLLYKRVIDWKQPFEKSFDWFDQVLLEENQMKERIIVAIRENHFDCLKDSMTGLKFNSDYVCTTAAKYGRLNMLRYAHAAGCYWSTTTTAAAAGNGHLDCLRFAHENGCPWNSSCCVTATVGDHLNCLQYVIQCGGHFNDMVLHAARNGSLKCLKYAHYLDLDFSYITLLIEYGHVKCIKYGNEHGWFENVDRENVLNTAAGAKNLPIFMYLSSYYPWTKRTTAIAALAGNFKMLRFAHQKGCPWDAKTAEGAAKNGSVDCLKYIYEQECPVDFSTILKICSTAGYLECLEWLASVGILFFPELIKLASVNGHTRSCSFIKKTLAQQNEDEDFSYNWWV